MFTALFFHFSLFAFSLSFLHPVGALALRTAEFDFPQQKNSQITQVFGLLISHVRSPIFLSSADPVCEGFRILDFLKKF